MTKRPRLDVATLITGLALTGFAILSLVVATGHTLVQPASIWFALVLLGSGIVGLVVSLARGPEEP
ncbi:hypothetical protein LKO27_02510 [Tessaracoccus sp. OS52]|uniref:hypothetical protein n=1 Tax=Tessaracoccus sp. OS52 TaxID=2886691 RepID=UPI001D10CB5A|nr:hypothetical protein [Tessaracoccus sp. OS52]MCC2592295.1 hypothetical protein [Tessaracoccus sp. OS52]